MATQLLNVPRFNDGEWHHITSTVTGMDFGSATTDASYTMSYVYSTTGTSAGTGDWHYATDDAGEWILTEQSEFGNRYRRQYYDGRVEEYMTSSEDGGSWEQYQSDRGCFTIKETAKQRKAREVAARKAARESMKAQKNREKAARVAERLLTSVIGKNRVMQLDDIGYVEVDSRKYKTKKYRVRREGMIDVVGKNGRVLEELCVQPSIWCPNGDKVLSKVLLLENNEEYMLETANHFKR